MKVDPEPFEDPAELDRTWGRQWGAWDEVGQLREVLVWPIGEELDQIDAAAWDPELDGLVDPSGGWYWQGSAPPDIELAKRQHDGLTAARG